MAISILNNPASLAAQNQLGITNTNLQKALYQLSSGSRINSGADDAAGLAVADGLMANITALTQSARNASDGVGKLQVADGALAQVTTLLNRAITLATESANGTLSDTQRAPLQAEFASIKSEIDRIGATTNFNGLQVFQNTTVNTYVSTTGSLTNASPLGGSSKTETGGTSVNATDSLGWTFGKATSSVGALTGISPLVNGGDGTSVQTYAAAGTGGFSFAATSSSTVNDLLNAVNASTGYTGALTGGNVVITAKNQNAPAVTVTATGAASTSAIGNFAATQAGTTKSITIGPAGAQFAFTADGGVGHSTVGDLLAAINGSTAGYHATLSGPGGTSGDLVVTNPGAPSVDPAVAGTMAAQFGSFTLSGAPTTLTVTPYNTGTPVTTTFTDSGNLTVGQLISNINAIGLSASLNSSGSLVIGDPNNPTHSPTIGGTMTGTGVLGANTAGTGAAAANTNIYLTDDSANAANTIAVAIGALSSSSMNGASLTTDNLSTQIGSQSALADISAAINNVAALRGTLGASVNRLQSATNVINTSVQNLTSAQDNIRAADIPSTVASMAKYSILEQTGVASLSQANQMQQLVLKLIQ
jgi:flagellin